MIRRVSQGNPRIFIRIMNDLFENNKGKKLPISLKSQHAVIESFSQSFCKETKTLEGVGPEAEENLNFIASVIHEKTHEKQLSQVGLSFKIKPVEELQNSKLWLKKAVAFSRVFVDDNSLVTEITIDTIFELSNLYAAYYWLPMRPMPSTTIQTLTTPKSVYKVKSPKIARKSRKDQKSITPGQICMELEEI